MVDALADVGALGVESHAVLALGEGEEGLFGIEVGDLLVEEGVVAGHADVLHDAPAEPEEVIVGVGAAGEAGAPVLLAEEPVDDVALDELLGGVEEDVGASSSSC